MTCNSARLSGRWFCVFNLSPRFPNFSRSLQECMSLWAVFQVLGKDVRMTPLLCSAYSFPFLPLFSSPLHIFLLTLIHRLLVILCALGTGSGPIVTSRNLQTCISSLIYIITFVRLPRPVPRWAGLVAIFFRARAAKDRSLSALPPGCCVC